MLAYFLATAIVLQEVENGKIRIPPGQLPAPPVLPEGQENNALLKEALPLIRKLRDELVAGNS